jgi:hypothetical protein
MWQLDFAEFDVTENKLKLFTTFDLSVRSQNFPPFFSHFNLTKHTFFRTVLPLLLLMLLLLLMMMLVVMIKAL